MTNKELAKKYNGIIKGGCLVFEGHRGINMDNEKVLPKNTKFNNGGWVSLNGLTTLDPSTKFNNSGWVSLDGLTTLDPNTKFNNSGDVYLNGLTTLDPSTKFNNGGDISLDGLTTLDPSTKFNNSGYVYLNRVCFKDKSWVFKIVNDELSAEEVFAIDNIEHRRLAYEYMDKRKMKELEDFEIIDKGIDEKGKEVEVVSFTVQNMDEPLLFYHCIDSSTDREYYLQTDKKKWKEAKARQFGFVDEVTWVNEW